MYYGTRTGKLVLGLMLLALWPQHLLGQDSPAFRDLTLSVHCRQTLASDSRLAELNLAVQVKRGIAEVRGRVPSEELERRAVQLVGEVQGILAVRNYLEVRAVAREPDRLVLEVEEASSTRAALPTREPLPEVTLNIPAAPMLDLPPELRPNPFPASEVALPRTTTPPVAILLPPVAVEPVQPREMPRIPARDVLVANPAQPSTLAGHPGSLQALLNEPVYRAIKVENRNGVVYIHNRSSQAGAVMTLARRLSDLPEVQQIVLVPEGR